jgi:hypothetical protein
VGTDIRSHGLAAPHDLSRFDAHGLIKGNAHGVGKLSIPSGSKI